MIEFVDEIDYSLTRSPRVNKSLLINKEMNIFQSWIYFCLKIWLKITKSYKNIFFLQIWLLNYKLQATSYKLQLGRGSTISENIQGPVS
jgi:hypothetical protein